MNFSLFVVFEGSIGLGPVPICRIADDDITKDAVARALENASGRAEATAREDAVIHSDICQQAEDLRGILAML